MNNMTIYQIQIKENLPALMDALRTILPEYAVIISASILPNNCIHVKCLEIDEWGREYIEWYVGLLDHHQFVRPRCRWKNQAEKREKIFRFSIPKQRRKLL
jgi:hypothetical protein